MYILSLSVATPSLIVPFGSAIKYNLSKKVSEEPCGFMKNTDEASQPNWNGHPMKFHPKVRLIFMKVIPLPVIVNVTGYVSQITLT